MTVDVLGAPQSLDRLPAVVTEQELAELLGVQVERVRRWSHTGRGPKTFKIGNLRLVRRESLLAWFQSRER